MAGIRISLHSKVAGLILKLITWPQWPHVPCRGQRPWWQKAHQPRSRPAPKSGAPYDKELLKESSRQGGGRETTPSSDAPKPCESLTARPSAEETTKAPPRTPLAPPNPLVPAFPTPKASVLHQPNFWPANPSFAGCIQEPEGVPSCAGEYSDVWRCPVQFFSPTEALPTEVAVTVLRSAWLNCDADPGMSEDIKLRFQQEAITWLQLPSHPNIVPLIGWTLAPNPSFISPWYEQGNLYRHLKHLSDVQRFHVLIGIAKGLDFLHSRSPSVVHGDLKPENILLSDSGEPLLTNFGLPTVLGEEVMYTSSYRAEGSVPWMSPECFRGESRSCQSDIYSFGTLAFTVLTGEVPYVGLTEGQIVLTVLDSNTFTGPVADWSRYPRLQGPIKDLLLSCWSSSPSARPSMSAIARQLAVLESCKLESFTLQS